MAVCPFNLKNNINRSDYPSTPLKKHENTHVLQMPQWWVLAGLGMMHFLQTDTNGLLFLSWEDN